MPDDRPPMRIRDPGPEEADVQHTAVDYARSLLKSLDAAPLRGIAAAPVHPALVWAHSGLMALTGRAGGDPQMFPTALAACADGALAALAAVAPAAGVFHGLSGAALLTERAAVSGLSRQGAQSCGGRCRLMAAADARVAVNLPREDDWSLVPAWLEAPVQSWSEMAECVARQPAAVLIERARWLGLAVAVSDAAPPPAPWFQVVAQGARRRPGGSAPVRVLDLSSLWAGPLCGRLLARMGAEVVKVESAARPDGARLGPSAFFDAMNTGKASVLVDFATDRGRAQLAALLDRADIVIEASRPRALRQLGIDAEARVRERPGLTWISLTGYGRHENQEHRIAYGDDAGVAAGLSEWLHRTTDQVLFCGDAIADPLTGLHAALAAWTAHCSGGGRLLSIALRDVAAHAAGFGRPASPAHLVERAGRWQRLALGQVRQPRRPRPAGAARPPGADTAAVFRHWGLRC